jgi:hypothetical protein
LLAESLLLAAGRDDGGLGVVLADLVAAVVVLGAGEVGLASLGLAARRLVVRAAEAEPEHAAEAGPHQQPVDRQHVPGGEVGTPAKVQPDPPPAALRAAALALHHAQRRVHVAVVHPGHRHGHLQRQRRRHGGETGRQRQKLVVGRLLLELLHGRREVEPVIEVVLHRPAGALAQAASARHAVVKPEVGRWWQLLLHAGRREREVVAGRGRDGVQPAAHHDRTVDDLARDENPRRGGGVCGGGGGNREADMEHENGRQRADELARLAVLQWWLCVKVDGGRRVG